MLYVHANFRITHCLQTQQNELKKERRATKALVGDEDDIDAMLQKCALDDKTRTVLTMELDCAAPSARVNASFIPYVAPVRGGWSRGRDGNSWAQVHRRQWC